MSGHSPGDTDVLHAEDALAGQQEANLAKDVGFQNTPHRGPGRTARSRACVGWGCPCVHNSGATSVGLPNLGQLWAVWSPWRNI